MAISKDSDTAPVIGPPPGVETPKPSIERRANADNIIIFYCTCGNKLNAPAKLQGRAAQCPHCGLKLRVPTEEELAAAMEDDEITEDFPEAPLTTDSGPVEDEVEIEDEDLSVDLPDPDQFAGEADIVVAEDDVVIESGSPAYAYTPTVGGHALAHVFGLLWNERGENGVIELIMKDGETLTPEFFAVELSRDTHAVFATRDDEGIYTLTSIPWENVVKAEMKNVDRLPPGIFQ